MRVALVQFAAGFEPEQNRRRIGELLSALAEVEPVDLVVLPEASMADYANADSDLRTVAEPLDGPFVHLLAHWSSTLGATVVAGMFEQTDGLPFNTVVALGPAGRLVASYRKIHLYDSFGYRESDRIRAGDVGATTFEVGDTRIGLMTCYDLRFPESARLLADAGAELMVLPAAWVGGEHKLDHWRILIRARAIENTAYVLAVGQSGPRYCGHSMIVDPWGTIVDEAKEGDETLIVDIDATVESGLVTSVRRINPSLVNRRIRTL